MLEKEVFFKYAWFSYQKFDKLNLEKDKFAFRNEGLLPIIKWKSPPNTTCKGQTCKSQFYYIRVVEMVLEK